VRCYSRTQQSRGERLHAIVDVLPVAFGGRIRKLLLLRRLQRHQAVVWVDELEAS